MRQYVTEDEAKLKLCPMWRGGEMNGVHHTPSCFTIHAPAWGNCHGSACMFWCWKDEYGAGMGVVASDTHGYCGATK